jgi:hypothetical protein
LLRRDPGGKPIWEDLAVLRLPRLLKTDQLLFGDCFSCKLNGSVDPEIVVIAKPSAGPALAKILHAWRASTATLTFQVISTQGITCENPDYGY